jgi:hypothetical protein
MITNTHTTQIPADEQPTVVMADRFMMPVAMNDELEIFTGFVEHVSLPGVVLTGQLVPQFTAIFISPCGHPECGHRVSDCLN